jgi:predicted metal-dependent hydrolase
MMRSPVVEQLKRVETGYCGARSHRDGWELPVDTVLERSLVVERAVADSPESLLPACPAC